MTICACDTEGHLLIIGHGRNEAYDDLPLDIFFDSDYSPLLRDSNHYVVDEQTQVPPHLMPPPFLIDRQRNPYGAKIQKFVPGRERLAESEANVPGAVEQDLINNLNNPAPNADGPAAVLVQAVNIPPAAPPVPMPAAFPAPPVAPAAAAAVPALNGAGAVAQIPAPLLPLEPIAPPPPPAAAAAPAAAPVPQAAVLAVTRKIVRNCVKKRQKTIDAFVERTNDCSIEEYAIFLSESQKGAFDHDYFASSSSRPGLTARERKKQAKAKARRTPNSGASARAAPAPAPVDEEEEEEDNEAEAPANDDDTSDMSLEEDDLTDEESTEVSSEHSDWGSDNNDKDAEMTSPTQQQQQQVTPTPAAAKKKKSPKNSKKRSAAQKCREKMLLHPDGIRDEYMPSMWLSEYQPKKTPYFPQMHDVLVYFKLGHERYLELVKTRKTYEINMKEQDWLRRRNIEEVISGSKSTFLRNCVMSE